MSPIAFNSFRFTDSTLDLNGPSLSFSEQPSDTTVLIGNTITLSGISTLSISPFSGTINYQWYNSTDGTPVSNGERTNESGSISVITGATSENLSITSFTIETTSYRIFKSMLVMISACDSVLISISSKLHIFIKFTTEGYANIVF